MSYILDALNKAEQERRLGDVPRLHVTGQAAAVSTEARTGRLTMALLVALAALIVIAALLLWLRPWASDSIYMLTVRTVRPDPALQTTPAAPAIMRAAPPLQAPQEPAVAQPVPAAPAERPVIAAGQLAAPPVAAPPVAAPVTASVPGRPAATAPVPVPSVPVPPAVAPAVAPPAVAPPAVAAAPTAARPPTAPPASSAETIPRLRELPQNIQQQIPALAVSGYIYAEQPEDRSIIINQKFAREGEQVAPDLQLERLTPTGMILNFRGYRYRAPY